MISSTSSNASIRSYRRWDSQDSVQSSNSGGLLVAGRPPRGNLEVFWGKSSDCENENDPHIDAASIDNGPVFDPYDDDDDESSSTNVLGHGAVVKPTADQALDDTSDDLSEETKEKTLWKSFARVSFSNRQLQVDFYDDSDDDEEYSDYSVDDDATLQTRATKAIEKHNKSAARRIQRHGDYFNPGYVPNEAERKDIEKLSSELIVSQSVIRRPSFGKELCGYELAQIVLDPIKGARHEFIRYRGASVMLKKGPVIFRSMGNNFLSFGSGGVDEAKELILFNHSILVASIVTRDSSDQAASNADPKKSMMRAMKSVLKFAASTRTPWHVSKTVDFCEQLTKVVAVVDLSLSNFSHTSQDDSGSDVLENIMNGFRIVLPNKSLTFSCVTAEDKEAWLDALSIVVMQGKGNACDAVGNVSTLGYEIMKTDAFSAVVCGDANMLKRAISASKVPLMTPDGNGYTLCHYAVMKDHPSCVKVLLDAGADPDCKDVFDKAPGCYARSQEVINLLLGNGADGDNLPDLWDTSNFSDRADNSSHSGMMGRVLSASNLRRLVPS